MTTKPDLPLPSAFNQLAWSNLSAQSAEQIALAAAPMVAVLMLGVGEGQVGLLQTALTLPFLLFAIPAGVLADWISRRMLMVGAEAIRTISLLVILALTLSDRLTLVALAALGFVSVCGTVMYSVAAPSLIPSLVPASKFAQANARIELARTIAFASGPALGGMLVGWLGGASAFVAAALLSGIAVIMLSGVREPARPPVTTRQPLKDIREGLSFVSSNPLLRPVFLTQLIFGAGAFMTLAVFVPYAVNRLHQSASAIGIILAMYGVGMITGALMATRMLRWLPFGTVIAIGPVSGFVASVVMALTTVVPSPLLAGFSFFLLGSGPILWVISTTTLRQSITPPAMLGRASAINILSYGARPLGTGIAALVGGLYGADICLYLAVAVFGWQAILILTSPAVLLRRQPEQQKSPDQPCEFVAANR